MTIVTRLGACAFVVCLAACLALTSASVGTPPSAGSSSTADLAGHTFDITGITYDGTAEPIVPGSSPSLAFDESRLRVVTGCNGMSADYAVAGDRLTPTNGISTAIGCPPALGTQEQRLSRLLETTSVLAPTADGYRLTAGPVTVTLART